MATQPIELSGSTYRVFATHMVTGQAAEFEVIAMDAGEALDQVERGGIFAADDAELIDPTECMTTDEYLAAVVRGLA